LRVIHGSNTYVEIVIYVGIVIYVEIVIYVQIVIYVVNCGLRSTLMHRTVNTTNK